MTSIVTKTGDKGTTGLYGGRRLRKDDARIEAYGTVDELNACIGVVLAEKDLPPTTRGQLESIQHLLFRVGGDLATPMDVTNKQERVSETHVGMIEEWIASLEKDLPAQRSFLLPGGCRAAALLHQARTVCRRAERRITTLANAEMINPDVGIVLNRLSDYLFLAAREANKEAGMGDVEVRY